MSDLNKFASSQAIAITDGVSQFVATSDTLPSSSAVALNVREARQAQSNMAGSIPVAIASDQSTIPISGTVLTHWFDGGTWQTWDRTITGTVTATGHTHWWDGGNWIAWDRTITGTVTATGTIESTGTVTGLTRWWDGGNWQPWDRTITGTVAATGTVESTGTVSIIPTGTQVITGTVESTGTVSIIPTGTQVITGTVSERTLDLVAAIDNHSPAGNTDAVITYTAAGSGTFHVLEGVCWSYDTTPTGGNLTIEDGSAGTILSVDITASGAGVLPFKRKFNDNQSVTITLAAGGGSVVGKVNALGHWIES